VAILLRELPSPGLVQELTDPSGKTRDAVGLRKRDYVGLRDYVRTLR
jgi:hypothetical protein